MPPDFALSYVWNVITLLINVHKQMSFVDMSCLPVENSICISKFLDIIDIAFVWVDSLDLSWWGWCVHSLYPKAFTSTWSTWCIKCNILNKYIATTCFMQCTNIQDSWLLHHLAFFIVECGIVFSLNSLFIKNFVKTLFTSENDEACGHYGDLLQWQEHI